MSLYWKQFFFSATICEIHILDIIIKSCNFEYCNGIIFIVIYCLFFSWRFFGALCNILGCKWRKWLDKQLVRSYNHESLQDFNMLMFYSFTGLELQSWDVFHRRNKVYVKNKHEKITLKIRIGRENYIWKRTQCKKKQEHVVLSVQICQDLKIGRVTHKERITR